VTHRLESRMREIRPSGSEGGVADNGHPYPYPGGAQARLGLWKDSGMSPKELPR